MQETDKANPLSSYGADKLASELYAHIAFHQFNVPTVCARIFNVYGPRQRPDSPYSGVISIFADKLKQQKPITIFGDGEQTRDFIYVKDVVAFLMKASQLEHQSALIMNACTGKKTTINTLFKIMSKIIGNTVDVKYAAPRSEDVYNSCGNPTLAKNNMDFQTQYSLENGLASFLSNT